MYRQMTCSHPSISIPVCPGLSSVMVVFSSHLFWVSNESQASGPMWCRRPMSSCMSRRAGTRRSRRHSRTCWTTRPPCTSLHSCRRAPRRCPYPSCRTAPHYCLPSHHLQHKQRHYLASIIHCEYSFNKTTRSEVQIIVLCMPIVGNMTMSKMSAFMIKL